MPDDDVIKASAPISGSGMEAFMPLVTTGTQDDTNFISPWDWGLPSMSYRRHSAASLILGEYGNGSNLLGFTSLTTHYNFVSPMLSISIPY